MTTNSGQHPVSVVIPPHPSAVIDVVLGFSRKARMNTRMSIRSILAHATRQGTRCEWILDTHPMPITYGTHELKAG